MEGGVGARWKVGPVLEHRTLRQCSMTPQTVKLCSEVGGGAVGVFFGSGETFRIAEDAVSVHIEAIVVPIEGQITAVQGIKGRAGVPQRNLVKPTHAMAHVGLVSVGHAVAVGVGDARVEVHPVVVFIELSRKATRKTWGCAVGRVGPTEFFGGVQAVPVAVG